MTETNATCPMTYQDIVETYFMEHRARLIDVAAFLDRLDRAADGPTADEDFRMEAFRRALDVLRDGEPHRARRLLELFSDHTTDPIDKAPMQGALGAAPPASESNPAS